MKKLANVFLVGVLFFNSMGDGMVQAIQKTVPVTIGYENEYLLITAGPDEEEGHLSIIHCQEEDIVSAEIYAAYEGETFSVYGEMEEMKGSLPFPEEDSSVDFYILADTADGKKVKSNIVTFYHEDSYYYEITKDSDGDGIPDGYEVRDLGTDPEEADTDGDGFPDGYEIQVLHTNPLNRTEDGDYDGDGLKNSKEMEKGTNPYLWDTDFDGSSDKKDKAPLINTGKPIVKKEQLPEFQRGYYDMEEVYQDENGIESVVVTNILSGKVQWVKTGESYSRYFYDFEGRKPIAELSYYEDSGEYAVTQLTYEDGQLTNVNQNGSTKEIAYTENGQLSRYYEEGNMLYEKQYNGGLVSQIIYGNGDYISYQYDHHKNMTAMVINGEEAYTWQYNKDGVVSRYTDEREKTVEERSYDEWLELTGKTQENGLSVNHSVNGEETSAVYKAGGETKEVIKIYSENGENTAYTMQFPQGVEICITNQNGESQKAVLQSGKEIVSCGKSKKEKEKVEKEKEKAEKAKKDKKEKEKGQEKNNEKRDEIGNLIEKDGVRYGWEGLLLRSYVQDGIKAEYVYDVDGNRIKKTVNGVESKYGVDEGNLIYEERGDEAFWYYYDADGLPAAFETDGRMYLYEKDDEGNIIALYNTEGEAEAEYMYDEEGNLLEVTGNQELGEANSFRYQSAYYDEESGLYYSYGRYYDTEEGVFLNGDAAYEAEPEKEETYLNASYYGAAVEGSGAIAYAASGYGVKVTPERGLSSPSLSNKLYSWSTNCLRYNCYSYAVDKTSQAYDPGTISNKYGNFKGSIELGDVVKRTLVDLEDMGYIAKVVNMPYQLRPKERLIAVKVCKDGLDYHFMKRIIADSSWRHKPGRTAILTYRESPSWPEWIMENFDVISYTWNKSALLYNSSTVYIAYGTKNTYK